MANKFLSDIDLTARLRANGQPGTNGQVLTSTETGVSWVSPETIPSESAEHVQILVKNTSGATIAKGTPVYVTGETGNSGKIEIAPADASDSAKMPALGLLLTALNDNGEGYCVTGGLLEGLATATIDGTTSTANDTVYVKAGGGLTLTKPTGAANLIQNVAKVARVHASNGSFIVSSILRTNDVPNLNTGKIWVGDGNTTESTVVHLDETNGRMGIGTTSPSSVLHVSSGGTETTLIVGAEGSGFDVSSRVFLNEGEGGATNSLDYGFSLAYDGNGSQYGGISANQFGIIRHNNSATGTSVMTMNRTNDNVSFPGNVGIGTTSPTAKLHVLGTTSSIPALGGAPSALQLGGSSYGTLFSTLTSGSGVIQQGRVDGQATSYNLLIQPVGGNVGIGTTSPGSKLHVTGEIRAYDNANTYYARLFANSSWGYFNTNAPKIYINKEIQVDTGLIGSYNEDLQLRTEGTTRIFVEKDNGNVGIGTTTPQSILHIYKSNSGGVGGELRLDNNNSAVANKTRIVFDDGNGNSTSAERAAIVCETENNPYMGQLQFQTGIGSLSTKMLIQGNGNVGIGTTSPDDSLHVSQGSNSFRGITIEGTSPALYLNDTEATNAYHIAANGDYLYFLEDSNKSGSYNNILAFWNPSNNFIFNTGNVGIGTTNPSAKLEVSDSANDLQMRVGSLTAGISPYIRLQGKNTANTTNYYADIELDAENGKLIFKDPGTSGGTIGQSPMVIDSSGNVGIGTTTPTAPLHVDGGTASEVLKIEADANPYIRWVQSGIDVGFLQFSNNNAYLSNISAGSFFFRTSNTDRMVISSSGNVGIGTTVPSNKLEVAGTILGNGGIIGSSDLLLRDQASAYSTELKMQNNIHTLGIDYQNNETLRFITRSGTTTVPITFQMRAGTITAANFILSSDERKKSKIKDLSSDNIDVRWRSFEMKDNEGEYRTGVVAQELEEKHPEFVNTDDEGFKSVKYIDLLIAKIAELEARLEKAGI